MILYLFSPMGDKRKEDCYIVLFVNYRVMRRIIFIEFRSINSITWRNGQAWGIILRDEVKSGYVTSSTSLEEAVCFR